VLEIIFLLSKIRAVDTSRAPFSKTSHTAWHLKMGSICCPKMSVSDDHSTLYNIPQMGRSKNFETTKIKSEYWNHDGQDSLFRASQEKATWLN
jgi:hypothetical protein